MNERKKSYYSIGNIMSQTSLIYQRIDNLEEFTKENVLKIVNEGIAGIDKELDIIGEDLK